MPKAVTYSPNSIVFFKGDLSGFVYVLKSGQVSLNYTDLQTGAEVHDTIQTGEFFGVKAALGGYIHDETAQAIVESQVLLFTVAEFESLISRNKRLIAKMLRVFSTQLRRIHNQVQDLLSSDTSTDPELGLFEVGRYYQKEGDPLKARAAFEKYLKYYPQGTYLNGVQKALQELSTLPEKDRNEEDQPTLFICKKKMDRGEYRDAFRGLSLLYKGGELEKEDILQVEFLLGICLFQLRQFKEGAAQFTRLIRKYPRHDQLDIICYYLGLCYYELEDKVKAKGFLTKSLTMLKDNQKKVKASEILRELKGEG